MPRTKTIDLNQSSKKRVDEATGLVEAIAKLLSSYELRSRFEHSPKMVAEELKIPANDRDAFVALDPRQLHRQSDTLLNKRWHEVRRLLPQTIESMGAEAIDVFRFYATNDWPVGHRRHPDDAFRFLQFLVANRIQEPNKTELKRIRRLSSVGR